MAEIEFKRRGTPLWVVVLALLIIAATLWFFFARAGGPGVPTSAGPAEQVPPGQTPPATAPPAAAAAPPAATSMVSEYVTFLGTTPGPSAGEAATYVADALQRLAGALQERYPNAGVQHMVIRASADSLRMPNVAPVKQTELTQGALFAAAFAMGRGGAGDRVNAAATQVLLGQPLRAQLRAVRAVLDSARSVLEGPGAPRAAGGAPTPKS